MIADHSDQNDIDIDEVCSMTTGTIIADVNDDQHGIDVGESSTDSS